jgi:hypothetical protein
VVEGDPQSMEWNDWRTARPPSVPAPFREIVTIEQPDSLSRRLMRGRDDACRFAKLTAKPPVSTTVTFALLAQPFLV